VLFVMVHFWRIRKDGGLYVRESEPGKDEPEPIPGAAMEKL